ncbi:MAG: ComF family protein [Pyrinomonadaceae bacterium]
MFRAFQNSLLNLISPQACHVCSNEIEDHRDGAACSRCWAATRIFYGSEILCDKCGAFFGAGSTSTPVFCHKCDDHQYEKAIAIGIYEKALASSVIELKTSPVLPHRLKRLIERVLERAEFSNITLIIPVPLSPKRKIERGFNQAEAIARVASDGLRVPVDAVSLERKLHSPLHRIGMDQRARELTVQKAFEVRRPKLIQGRDILLVDDVFTSGSTASHCAASLRRNGAKRVKVFTLARAVMHS